MGLPRDWIVILNGFRHVKMVEKEQFTADVTTVTHSRRTWQVYDGAPTVFV